MHNYSQGSFCMVEVMKQELTAFFDLMDFCKFGGETHAPNADNPSDGYMMGSVHVPLFIIIACMCLLNLTSLSLSKMNSGRRMTCLTKRFEFEYFTSSPQPVYSINKWGKHTKVMMKCTQIFNNTTNSMIKQPKIN